MRAPAANFSPTPPPPKRVRPRWPIGLGLLLAAWSSLVLVSCVRTAPALGPIGGRLIPCPTSPNCVCSYDTTATAAIAPLPCPGPARATQELIRLRALVMSQPRTRLLEETPGYLRFEVTTGLFRFRDDLEFLADDNAKLIHVRSASRLGHSDLGTNRRRVETIRRLFSPPTPGTAP